MYTDMERISRIWEIELQAVLEINKLGHRKRILYSVGAVPPKISTQLTTALANSSIPPTPASIASATTTTTKTPTTESNNQKLPTSNSDGATSEQRKNHEKKRQAPKPPTNENSILAKMNDLNLEIREPAELLLGFPTGLSTQWRHTAEALVSGVKYEVNVSKLCSGNLNMLYNV